MQKKRLDQYSDKNNPYMLNKKIEDLNFHIENAKNGQYHFSDYTPDERAERIKRYQDEITTLKNHGVPENERNNAIQVYKQSLDEKLKSKPNYNGPEPKAWSLDDFKFLRGDSDKHIDELFIQDFINNKRENIFDKAKQINMNDLPELESGYKKQHLNSLISSGVGLAGTAGLVGGVGYAGSKLYKSMKKPLVNNIIKEAPKVESVMQHIEETPKTHFIDKSLNWIKENPGKYMLASIPLDVYAINKMVSNEREEAVRKDRSRR